jgi:hypothetical protein
VFNEWLKQTFMRKDSLMSRFYETGEMSSQSQGWKVVPGVQHWVVILSVWGLGLFIIPFFYRTVFGIVMAFWNLIF